MNLDPVALQTLAAVVQEGTFERGSARLHVTPSAVSQRLKALEQEVGQVLLSRAKPVTPTRAGEVLLRLAGHWELLAHEALAELVPQADPVVRPLVPVVVNADSLATWFLPALARAGDQLAVTFEVVREDEEHATARLRSGAALAAVTADPRPVPGCRITPLGSMRYLAVATPRFRRTWFSLGPRAQDLDRAPVIRFDRKDTMQHRLARRWAGREVDPPATYVASSREFAEAVRLGMGWGLVPRAWLTEDLDTGALVPLGDRAEHDVPLHWLCWRLPSLTLELLTRSVQDAAAEVLLPPVTGAGGRQLARVGQSGPR